MDIKATYSDKLKDPRWQKKRLEIMSRDGFTCRWCKSKTNTLHVHHLSYINANYPWESEDNNLITLCESCHNVAHLPFKITEDNGIMSVEGLLKLSPIIIRCNFIEIGNSKGTWTVLFRKDSPLSFIVMAIATIIKYDEIDNTHIYEKYKTDCDYAKYITGKNIKNELQVHKY